MKLYANPWIGIGIDAGKDRAAGCSKYNSSSTTQQSEHWIKLRALKKLLSILDNPNDKQYTKKIFKKKTV